MLLRSFLLLGSLARLFAQPALPITTFRLYTEYDLKPPEQVRNAMEQEVESIMEPIGWPVAWSSVRQIAVGEVSAALAVVHFTGECDVPGKHISPFDSKALAWTRMVEGEILPFSGVDCSAVGAFLAPELISVKAQKRQAMFGRALGRVLAHEGAAARIEGCG